MPRLELTLTLFGRRLRVDLHAAAVERPSEIVDGARYEVGTDAWRAAHARAADDARAQLRIEREERQALEKSAAAARQVLVQWRARQRPWNALRSTRRTSSRN